MDDIQETGLNIVYKRVGETPLQSIVRFKQDNPRFKDIPMTYAGRLDPMAEGLLMLLSGDAIARKDKYLDLPKTYECDVLWGFETDTLDVLGIVVDGVKKKNEGNDGVDLKKFMQAQHKDILKIQKILKDFVGVIRQKYPAYSSQPVLGKPLFQWSREGKIKEIPIPGHKVKLYKVKHVSRRFISGGELLAEIEKKVGLVDGDFRQGDIIEHWRTTLSDKGNTRYPIDTISLSVSSGFYVRQFVSDIARKLKTQAIAYGIKRTKIGHFELDL